MSKVGSCEVLMPPSSLPRPLCVFFSTLSSGMFDKLKLTVWTELTGQFTGHSSDLTLTVRNVYFSTLSSLMVELLTQVFKSGNMALLSGRCFSFQNSTAPPTERPQTVCVVLNKNPSEHVCLWSKCSPLCRHTVLTRLA